MPGPFQVGGDIRSIEPEGIQAAIWAGSRLDSNNRVATDATNQLLMGTLGDQYIVTQEVSGIDVSPVFFSLHLGPSELSILKSAQVDYLVVDLRLAQNLPIQGIYFYQDETDAYHHMSPIPRKALTKFSTIPEVDRIFDSGNIVIYNMKGLINAPETP